MKWPSTLILTMGLLSHSESILSFGQLLIMNISNLVRGFSASTEGSHLSFVQPSRFKSCRDESLSSHCGNSSIPIFSNCNLPREVRC